MKERFLVGFIQKAGAFESDCTFDPFIAGLRSACDVNLARPTCSDIQSLKKIAPFPKLSYVFIQCRYCSSIIMDCSSTGRLPDSGIQKH